MTCCASTCYLLPQAHLTISQIGITYLTLHAGVMPLESKNKGHQKLPSIGVLYLSCGAIRVSTTPPWVNITISPNELIRFYSQRGHHRLIQRLMRKLLTFKDCETRTLL